MRSQVSIRNGDTCKKKDPPQYNPRHPHISGALSLVDERRVLH
jgi:hypothetical protein